MKKEEPGRKKKIFYWSKNYYFFIFGFKQYVVNQLTNFRLLIGKQNCRTNNTV